VGAKSTMTPAPESRLLELYDRVADAPGAIDRLRKFVLDLAVRGKLVEQNPEDEPASKLLRRHTSVKHIDRPQLPHGWTKASIGQLLNFRYGKGLKKSERLESGPVPVFGSNGIVGYTETPLTGNPAIIVGRKGSAGALNLSEGASWTTDVAYYVEIPEFFQAKFLFTTLCTLELEKLGKGVKPGLSRADAYELEVPLPPLHEQHRIAAKVDELKALLDRLETTYTQRETTRDRLTTASLARLTAPKATEKEFRAAARFTFNNLDQLTSRPEQIKLLRQTILDLAVRGKLVEQDPADEPALAMLSAWVDKKVSQLPKARRSKLLDSWSAAKSSTPHDLPESWAWATAEELCKKVVDCPHSTPKFTASGIACLDTNSVKSTGLVAEKIRYVSEETFIKRNKRLTPRQGDVVFAREGSVGETVIVPAGLKCCLGQRVMLFRPGPAVSPEWFSLAISEHSSLVRLIGLHKGIGAKHVNVKDMRLSLQPLPPLHEQHRIVAKVGALMTLCNRLEVALTTANTNRARLLRALLHDALDVKVRDKEAA